MKHSPTFALVTAWLSGSLTGLGCSLKDLITRITELENRKIGFKSLTEQIDTTTSGGKLIFHIFGALAEFERTSSGSGRMPGLRQPGHGGN